MIVRSKTKLAGAIKGIFEILHSPLPTHCSPQADLHRLRTEAQSLFRRSHKVSSESIKREVLRCPSRVGIKIDGRFPP
jgi:hypothetical protein